MRRNTSMYSHCCPGFSARKCPLSSLPLASSSSSTCTARTASSLNSSIISSAVNGPWVLAYRVILPVTSSSGRVFQKVLPRSSSATWAMADWSSSDAMSVVPSSRSSTSGSMDSSCVLRSACGTSYWYITDPTNPNSMFSANGEGASVVASCTTIVPALSPDMTVRNAGRSYTSCRHSRAVSSSRGKFLQVRAALSSCEARSRCCHSGTRRPGLVLGRNSERAAHSRNRAIYSTLPPICVSMTRCMSSTSNSSMSAARRFSYPSGSRNTMPSSVAYAWASNPYRRLMRAVMANAHGSCTRRPYGECRMMRQSPPSSRQRSNTSVRSLGIVPVAARCSSSSRVRLPMALSSSPSCLSRSTMAACRWGAGTSSVESAADVNA